MNCENLVEYDAEIAKNEAEMKALRSRVAALEATSRTPRDLGPSAALGRSTPEEVSAVVDPPLVHGSGDSGHPRREPSAATRTVPTVMRPLLTGKPVGPAVSGDVASARMPPAVEESRIDATGTRASRKLETSEPSSMSRHGTTSPRSPGYEASRRGKAPPVDSFSGETTGLTFDDWFPSLQRASDWNQWSDEEALIQLAGHLRGRALQEWTLLRSTEKGSPDAVVCALWGCLDPGSRALAAQDFRHASQREKECCRLHQPTGTIISPSLCKRGDVR